MKSLISVFFLTVAVAAFGQHIAVLSDVHVSPGNEAEKQLRIAVDEINRGTFDFVVMDGDLTNEGSDAAIMKTTGASRPEQPFRACGATTALSPTSTRCLLSASTAARI